MSFSRVSSNYYKWRRSILLTMKSEGLNETVEVTNMWKHRERLREQVYAFLERKLERSRRTVTALFGAEEEEEEGR